MSDAEVLDLVAEGHVRTYKLESFLSGDATRAARLRRAALDLDDAGLAELPQDETGMDCDRFYGSVLGTNCENVVGFVPLPVGVVGPLHLDGRKDLMVPLATTEGALVASTNRGCRAIMQAGGAATAVYGDGMTRAPVVRLPSACDAVALCDWVHKPTNFATIKAAFESTTRFGKLLECKAKVAGRNVFLRFKCSAGDAMGMNMISKGSLEAMAVLTSHFPSMELLSISGNVCVDKKPSAINWIEGRGKSVVAEVVLPRAIIEKTLKCTVESLGAFANRRCHRRPREPRLLVIRRGRESIVGPPCSCLLCLLACWLAGWLADWLELTPLTSYAGV